MPGKRIDLVPISSDMELGKGLKFVLLSDGVEQIGGRQKNYDDEENGAEYEDDGDGDEFDDEDKGTNLKKEKHKDSGKHKCKGKGKTVKKSEEGNNEYEECAEKKKKSKGTRSISELSGGQLSLLGLSFVFAAALHKRSPLYLLDEVCRRCGSVRAK